MDRIIFTGRVGKDPEKQTSKAGKDYCRVNVAVTHYEGSGEKSTEWRQVTVFGKSAEWVLGNIRKGALVTVDGRCKPRAYIPKNGGDPVGVIDVVAESIEGLKSESGGSASDGPTDVTGTVEEELPF